MYKSCFRPKFKSYIPEDEGLKSELIPTPQPGDIVAEVEDQLKAGETVFTVQELVNLCYLITYLLAIILYVFNKVIYPHLVGLLLHIDILNS